MASPEGIYHGSIRAMSIVMLGLGLAILAVTLVGGGGPLSIGMLIGLAFVGVGSGRLYLASRMRR